jgi:hypothetical protein
MARRKKAEDNTEVNNNPVIQDDIDYYFIEFCNMHNIKDIYKIPSTQFVAALIYINHKYIRPNRIIYNNALAGYKYNLLAIDQLVDRFLYMSYMYNQPITLLNFSHFSGIGYEYICRWKNDNNVFVIDLLDCTDNKYIYNIKNLLPGKNKLTISYKSMYEKLISNQINNADLLASYKSGVNSIAWANRVHERHDKDRNNNKPVFDMVSAADSLGIADKLHALEDKKQQ